MEYSQESRYLRPGEHTAGIRNLMLFYNGHYESHAGIWKKDDFVPYISYVDESGRPREWFFDGALFLAKWSFAFRGYEGYPVGDERSNNLEDWRWYLDKTFGEAGDLAELNKAVEDVAVQLNDPGYKMKVVIMIPYPDPSQHEFGELAGSGPLSFDYRRVAPEEAHRNKQLALKWYVGQLLKRWDEADLPRLELSALYWMNEAVHQSVPQEEELIGWTRDLIHDAGLKFFWIPYFNAENYGKWKELGFDAAVLQPNHFFTETGADRIQVTADMAAKAGMGLEMEVDYRVFGEDGAFRGKYLNYLNGGVEYGFAGDVFRGYYQDVKLLAAAAYNEDPAKRAIYDMTYRFVKGTYVSTNS
ncbi:DUF4855 domain-containing protein [Paenibacillus spongiae]|uniref:DUF4855 domain-containing protein n=1 Tax=Paenibacillus spongiae TaxID=2909671 RepID=A0ABY5SC14_9BACL|nr:DUF4855 domain-containing protein [Paenibacillus spongiae]UVI31506.1 DUF4855 domain-containing protein [Paenibacillus spongiae]